MFNIINKIFNKKSTLSKIKTSEDIKKYWHDHIKSMAKWMEQLEKDYFNKSNYPLYQQEYYSFNKEIDNLNTLDEIVLFHQRVRNLFNHLLELYKETNIAKKEKVLLFYDEDYEFSLFNTYYKLLRKIWNKYKKFWEKELAYDTFLQIFLWATQDSKEYKFLMWLRVSDINFLEKYFKEKKENDLLEFAKTIKMKLNKLKEKEKRKIKDLIIQNWIKKYEQAINHFKEMNERWYKKAVSHNDDLNCEICKKNDNTWWIYADLEFPSWHQTYPFHKNCRCNVIYRLLKPDDEKLE